MKLGLSFLFFAICTFYFTQEELSFTANKRLLEPAALKNDNSFDSKDLVEISCVAPKSLNPQGTKKYQWSINGATEAGKGWILPKGLTSFLKNLYAKRSWISTPPYKSSPNTSFN